MDASALSARLDFERLFPILVKSQPPAMQETIATP
jgi:hypothetical protein